MSIEEKQAEFSLEALRKGDQQEISRLVQKLSPQIYRLALKMTGDPQDAEDILQETFLKALTHLDTFEGRSSVTTWLYRIGVNEALVHLRKKKPSISLDQPVETKEGELEPLEVVDWCCLPEEELVSGESRSFMDRAIASLPARLRAVFILRDIEGLNIRETAEALGITEANVKTRLLRARLQLRAALSGYFGERVKEKQGDETHNPV